MIVTENVTKYFGRVLAVDKVSFEIGKGEIVGFLGQNGAGKTTLMRIITTYIPASCGRIVVGKKDADKFSTDVRRMIGYLPENPPLYTDMTVRDYLKFAARLKDVAPAQLQKRIEKVAAQCQLKDVLHKPIAVLSKGYKQRIGIAQAIIHEPPILILDEPTNGLDPVQIRHVRELIKSFEGKKTVLISTHILPEIEHTARRVLIIKNGRLLVDRPMSELLKNGQKGKLSDGKSTLEQVFLTSVGAEGDDA